MKFRVWDKTSTTMYHAGFLLTQDGQLVYEAFPEDSVPDGICEVMFSTDIKDKDGKEIWEGDVVGFEDEDGKFTLTGEVKWREEVCLWAVDIGVGLTTVEPEDLWVPECRYEVLGNKWQNPELLEKSDG